MGKGERSLHELRGYANAGCQICGILLCGLNRFQQSWRHMDENLIRIRLQIQPNNAVYLEITDGSGSEGSASKDSIWLEFYTAPGKLNVHI